MTETPDPAPSGFAGHIDAFAFHPGAGGVLCLGWASADALAALPGSTVVLGFEGGDLTGPVLLSTYPRHGLPGNGRGLVVFMPAAARPEGEFFSLATTEHAGRLALLPGETAECTPERMAALLSGLAALDPPLPPGLLAGALDAGVAAAPPGALPAPVPAPTPSIEYTLSDLRRFVRLEVDEAITCPPHGLAMIGWMLAEPGALRALHLCTSARRVPLDPAHFVPVPRPGVIESVGRARGFEDDRCGFVAYVADACDPGEPAWIEVETEDGETGTRPLPARRLHGMAAIRRLLADCDPQFADLPPAFDHVLGPAVASLHQAASTGSVMVDVAEFGSRPATPDASLIVPLHGRLDFLELQMALLARDPSLANTELLLVLDDPPRRREAENLAESLHARFRRPFELLVLRSQRGFAGACNAGLARAGAPYVCWLNSDAFPTADGWLGRLIARLEGDAGLGLVAPVLTHEDGSVQHEGMAFRRVARMGNWWVPYHLRLGLTPSLPHGLHGAVCVTGAAIVLPRALAQEVGGFDEGFILGDYEDADLCLRLRATGRRIAIDGAERLVHLGRRSQGSLAERWRMNLVTCNAWRFQQKWAPVLAEAGTMAA